MKRQSDDRDDDKKRQTIPIARYRCASGTEVDLNQMSPKEITGVVTQELPNGQFGHIVLTNVVRNMTLEQAIKWLKSLPVQTLDAIWNFAFDEADWASLARLAQAGQLTCNRAFDVIHRYRSALPDVAEILMCAAHTPYVADVIYTLLDSAIVSASAALAASADVEAKRMLGMHRNSIAIKLYGATQLTIAELAQRQLTRINGKVQFGFSAAAYNDVGSTNVAAFLLSHQLDVSTPVGVNKAGVPLTFKQVCQGSLDIVPNDYSFHRRLEVLVCNGVYSVLELDQLADRVRSDIAASAIIHHAKVAQVLKEEFSALARQNSVAAEAAM